MNPALQDGFHTACSVGNEGVVGGILSAGTARIDLQIDLEKKTRGYTPLLVACWEGHTKIVEILIAAGSDVHAEDHEEFCCLHAACYKGFTKIIALLLDNGANIEALDDARSTPFAIASLNGHYKAMRLLAKRGANVSPLAKDRVSPLSMACCTGSENRVRVLLQLGADPKARVALERPGFRSSPSSNNAVFSNNGESCLLQVVMYLWPSPTVHGESADGRSAREDLMRRHLAIAEMLIAAGADLDQRHMGNTVLHMAAGIGSLRLMTALLRAGACTSSIAMAANGVAGTALSRAAAYCRPLAARLLLHAGALETAIDGTGRPPLQAVGTLALSVPSASEEELVHRRVAVTHALLRAPAFRATSWLWPVAACTAVAGGGSTTKVPAAAAAGAGATNGEGGEKVTAVTATRTHRSVVALPRYGERGRNGTPTLLSALWRYANKKG